MNSYINQLQGPMSVSPNVNSPGHVTNQGNNKFAAFLKDAVEQVNEAQIMSDNKKEALASGQIDDLHDVMITAQKASITLETSVQIQKKVIDAYNEIMRMQV